jgi:hypothetical protein
MRSNLIDVLSNGWVRDPREEERQEKLLRELVFAGLRDKNTGFDAASIAHFSPADFAVVIDRCDRFDVAIFGIEVFTSRHHMCTVEICPEEATDLEWARQVLQPYLAHPRFTISATYDVTNVFSGNSSSIGDRPPTGCA